MNKKNNKKVAGSVLALLLVAGISVVGTLAYLSLKTNEVSNTFTAAKSLIDDSNDGSEIGTKGFELFETKAFLNNGVYELDPDTLVYSNEYKSVVPKMTIAKDPVLRANIAKEARAYVFVEVKDNNSQMDYQISSNFKKVEGVTGLNGGDIYLYLNGGNKIVVGTDNVELDKVEILDKNEVVAKEKLNEKTGSLNFYGYLCQADSFLDEVEAFKACFTKESSN